MKAFLRYSAIGFLLLLLGCGAARDDRVEISESKSKAVSTSHAENVPESVTQSEADRGEALEKQLEKELSLSVVLELARIRNPRISIHRQKLRAAKYRILPARSLDDPMLMIGGFAGNPIETRAGAQEGRIGISQKLPWPGKVRLKGKVAEQDVEIRRGQMQATEQQVVKEVQGAYYQYYFAIQSIRITNENLVLLKGFEKVAETKYAAGKASQQDVLKAQVEISTLENTLLTLGQRKETAAARINTLIDRHPGAVLGVQSAVDLREFQRELSMLYNMAGKHRPELAAALANIKKNKITVDLAAKDYFPDVKVSLDYFFIEGGSNPGFRRDGEDAIMLSFGVNLPFFNKRKRDHNLRSAKLELLASNDMYRATMNDVLFQVKDSFERVVTSERMAKLFIDTIIPQSRQSLQVAEKQYEASTIDFLNLLDSQRKLLEFKLAYERALASFYQDWANLERAVGIELK